MGRAVAQEFMPRPTCWWFSVCNSCSNFDAKPSPRGSVRFLSFQHHRLLHKAGDPIFNFEIAKIQYVFSFCQFESLCTEDDCPLCCCNWTPPLYHGLKKKAVNVFVCLILFLILLLTTLTSAVGRLVVCRKKWKFSPQYYTWWYF